VLASAYAADDTHPVKDAVDHAAAEIGWTAEPWIAAMKSHAAPRLATLDGARAATAAAGLDAEIHHIDVPFPELDADDLVAWRLGMAQIAPFVATLSAAALERLRARALELLGPDPEPLVRRMIVVIART
jgi:hypothetical protein